MGFLCDYPEINCDRCTEILDVDGIEPDCDNCNLPDLLPENNEAWELYRTLNTQFVHDFHAQPLVFEIFGVQCTRAEAKGLLEKLILIHQMMKAKNVKQNTDNPGS